MDCEDANISLVAACGLFCGECPSLCKGKCPGCGKNDKATWCAVRSCCREKDIASCADCTAIQHIHCKKFNFIVARLFGFVFNSNRGACIDFIKTNGYEEFAAKMRDMGRCSFKRR